MDYRQYKFISLNIKVSNEDTKKLLEEKKRTTVIVSHVRFIPQHNIVEYSNPPEIRLSNELSYIP